MRDGLPTWGLLVFALLAEEFDDDADGSVQRLTVWTYGPGACPQVRLPAWPPRAS